VSFERIQKFTDRWDGLGKIPPSTLETAEQRVQADRLQANKKVIRLYAGYPVRFEGGAREILEVSLHNHRRLSGDRCGQDMRVIRKVKPR
jgi:hypothetical protein